MRSGQQAIEHSPTDSHHNAVSESKLNRARPPEGCYDSVRLKGEWWVYITTARCIVILRVWLLRDEMLDDRPMLATSFAPVDATLNYTGGVDANRLSGVSPSVSLLPSGAGSEIFHTLGGFFSIPASDESENILPRTERGKSNVWKISRQVPSSINAHAPLQADLSSHVS